MFIIISHFKVTFLFKKGKTSHCTFIHVKFINIWYVAVRSVSTQPILIFWSFLQAVVCNRCLMWKQITQASSFRGRDTGALTQRRAVGYNWPALVSTMTFNGHYLNINNVPVKVNDLHCGNETQSTAIKRYFLGFSVFSSLPCWICLFIILLKTPTSTLAAVKACNTTNNKKISQSGKEIRPCLCRFTFHLIVVALVRLTECKNRDLSE